MLYNKAVINLKLPLTDLHRHLDGNIRLTTIWDLAQKHNIIMPVSDFVDFKRVAQIQGQTSNLLAFLHNMELAVSVLANEQACYRVAYENVEDAKLAGLDYAELRFSPVFMAAAHQLPLESVADAVVAGIHDGSKNFSMPINLIGILSRSYGEKSCMQELQSLLRIKQHICALDLAGDEKGFPAKGFIEHFKLARDAGWQITVHAGEADGPNSIRQAINDLGATRIGHGVAAIEDQQLMDYMAEKQIALECCLTSNFQTGACADLAHHPIKEFLAKGMLVTLNTDDPGVSGIEISDEYNLAKNVLALTPEQLDRIQLNGVKAAFASDSFKDDLLTNTNSI
jgi:adenosine deaminase